MISLLPLPADLAQPTVTGTPSDRDDDTGQAINFDISTFFDGLGTDGIYVLTNGSFPPGINMDEGSGRITGKISKDANPTPADPAVTYSPTITYRSVKDDVSVSFDWDVTRVLRVAFAADTGDDNGAAMYMATSMMRFDPELVIIGGDNNYPLGEALTLDNGIDVFQQWFDEQKLIACYGNHDLDNSLPDPHVPQYDKFDYLPGNRRYYVWSEGNIDFFCINTGKDSASNEYEPDGNEVGSIQHTWFTNAVAASTAKFKVAFFHHGYAVVARSEGTSAMDRDDPRMNWFFEDHGIDLILNGHSHASTQMTYTGPSTATVPLINASSAVRPPLTIDPVGPHVEVGSVVVDWTYDVDGNGDPTGETDYWLSIETRGNDLTAKFVNSKTDTSPHQLVVTKP